MSPLESHHFPAIIQYMQGEISVVCKRLDCQDSGGGVGFGITKSHLQQAREHMKWADKKRMIRILKK